MLDRVTGMQIFCRAATKGSISAAARDLNMSPGMATKYVDALEARFGVKLFSRSTRRLQLTEPGHQYLESCMRLLPELEDMEARIASQRVEATGTLRLSASVSFGIRYISPLLPAFVKAYPNVTVDLGLNDRVIDLMEEGWDLGVRIGPVRDSRLAVHKLADSAMVICAAPSYWDGHGRPGRVTELTDHNCLGYSLTTPARLDKWTFGRGEVTSIPVTGTLRVNNGDALVAAAIAGDGIIYEPAFIVADAIRTGQLEAIALDVPLAELGGIHLVYAADREPLAKVRVMISFLAKRFETQLPWSF